MSASQRQMSEKRAMAAAIRQRAGEIREAERHLPAQGRQLWLRARAELEREFRRRTAHIGEYAHRWAPLLEIEEALTPGKSREPGGLKWTPSSERT